jgi:peptidoglycan LD-endopeptidase LytH
LEDSPLKNAHMVRAWREAGRLRPDSLEVDLPHSEHFYFDPQHPSAVFVHFFAREGEEILVSGDALPPDLPFFMDVFAWNEDKSDFERLISTDSTHQSSYVVKNSGKQVLRIQPELLAGGVVQLRLETKGVLSFPIPGKTSEHIGSFWGDPRDGGGRRHEGIDVFAPRGTPVLAASSGRVRRVGTNRLGGNVVWLYDGDLNHSQYYAHLDSQAVRVGQRVAKGDTLGFVGNTGNAITTPPHLHFGIYRSGRGAVDPFPFLRSFAASPEMPLEDAEGIGRLALVNRERVNFRAGPDTQAEKLGSLEQNTPLKVLGKTVNWVRVALPDGRLGFVFGELLEFDPQPLEEILVSDEDLLLLEWDWPQGISGQFVEGTAKVLGKYKGRLFIDTTQGIKGWLVN